MMKKFAVRSRSRIAAPIRSTDRRTVDARVMITTPAPQSLCVVAIIQSGGSPTQSDFRLP